MMLTGENRSTAGPPPGVPTADGLSDVSCGDTATAHYTPLSVPVIEACCCHHSLDLQSEEKKKIQLTKDLILIYDMIIS